MIQVEDLKKYYGSIRGVERVTLHVKQGEIFGFVGPNGSGKTTMIRTLLGLISKDGGSAKLFAKEVQIGDPDLNKDIGYMPSESYFFNEMKVKDIISFFKSMRTVDDSYLSMLIEQLDLDLLKKFGSLSFGNKKKVGLVVALMHQPKLLILDEPTSGLDPLIQSRFLEIITNERKRGTTVLLSSHVLSEIEKVCDRVALIKDGVILFIKTMDEIRQNEHKRLLVTPNHHDLILEGLSFIQDFDQSSQYAYVGDVNLLVQFLAKYKFIDINIRNVGLEEIFSIYYQKEDVK
ncbi:MAG TPA: ABC transporter [Acholeplasmataceae bacterium]|nr:ABC transporter [Acholeplasmataceae bacterium]